MRGVLPASSELDYWMLLLGASLLYHWTGSPKSFPKTNEYNTAQSLIERPSFNQRCRFDFHQIGSAVVALPLPGVFGGQEATLSVCPGAAEGFQGSQY